MLFWVKEEAVWNWNKFISMPSYCNYGVINMYCSMGGMP